MSSKSGLGFANQRVIVGVIVLFLVLVLFAAVLVLGMDPFGGGGNGGSAATVPGTQTQAQTQTQTRSPSDPVSSASVSSRSSETATARVTSRPTTVTATDEEPASETEPMSTNTSAEGFNTLTDRASAKAADTTARTETATQFPASETAAAANGSYTNEMFREALEAEGITVLTLKYDRTYSSGGASRPVVLEYATEASGGDGYRSEASVIARVYASAVADGYQPRALSASGYDASNQPVASYNIERTWASAYADGRISGEEYGRRISETYQSFKTRSIGTAAGPSR